MKKISLALLLAVACSCIILSCHKIGNPHKKTCQIRTIQYNYLNRQSQLTYSYNNKRLLTSIDGLTATSPVIPAFINITYNNMGKPITGNNFQNVPYRLIYENGRVGRIDFLGTDNLYHVKYTFVYDSLGRIRQRLGNEGFIFEFEYEGASPNFSRMTELHPHSSGFMERWAVHTYEYDDKINPWSTWQNTTLNPFYSEIFRGSLEEYIPIPQNNIIHYTIAHSFRGAPLKSDEFFYTYQYDGDYPVTQDFLRLVFNPFIPGFVDSTRGVNYYTYDCIGGDSKTGK
jgi:hypothetical protein